MFSSTDSQKKKKLGKNPFKPPSPVLARKQDTINFLLSKSKSSLGSSTIEITGKPPLEKTSPAALNRASSTPDTLFSSNKSKSSLHSMTSTSSFDLTDDNDDDDIVELSSTKVVKNLKHSKPLRSLIPEQPPKKYIVSNTTTTTTTPATTIKSSHFKPPAVSLGTLSESGNKSQPTLNFGSKSMNPKKRSMNPWDSQPLQVKSKNPRLKERKTPTSSFSLKPQSLTLSDEQKLVLDHVLKSKHNIFYTGSAGTGKSVLMKEIVKQLKYRYPQPGSVAVTASTGLAAVNVGGMTIHRFSGLGIGDKEVGAYVTIIKRKRELLETWKRTKVLIIDEISMLDGDFLDKLEKVSRILRREMNTPFGGIQVILTGDFFQLPPVPGNNGKPIKFCFESKSWSYLHKTILLTKVFRQSETSFINILNAIRIANVNDNIANEMIKLSRSVKYDDGLEPTELYCTRREVEFSNNRRLQKLTGKHKIFEALDMVKNEQDRKKLENTMALKQLLLKEGAQVMMLKNKTETLVNGSVGIVLTFLTPALFSQFVTRYNEGELLSDEVRDEMRLISSCYNKNEIPNNVMRYASSLSSERQQQFIQWAQSAQVDASEELPVVKFTTPDGFLVFLVEPEDFPVEYEDDHNTVPSINRRQIALLLSWALSIHKAQGQTLQRVKVDLQKVFEEGQVYVALSRAVSKDSLQILNFRRDKVRANKRVKDFYAGLETLQ